jgi:hypothetical protein
VQCNCYEINSQVQGKPALGRSAQHQEGNERYGIGNEVIHWVEAGCGQKVQLFLRMVSGVERPHEAASMLKPMDPIVAEVGHQKPEDSPRDRVEAVDYTELQESELCTKEAEKRRHEQKLIQPAAVVEPVSYVLQESLAAVLLGCPSRCSLQQVNKKIEDGTKRQRTETSVDNLAQGDEMKERIQYVSQCHRDIMNLKARQSTGAYPLYFSIACGLLEGKGFWSSCCANSLISPSEQNI